MNKYSKFPVNGFLKLPREVTNIYFWMNSPFDRVRAWLDLLMLASFRRRTVKFGKTEITVEPGELAYPIGTLAKRWQRSRCFVYSLLREFVKMGLIKVNSGTCTTVIRITDWEKYQYVPEKPRQGKDAKMRRVFRHPQEEADSLKNGLFSQGIFLPAGASDEGIDTIPIQSKAKKSVTTEEYINYKKKYASAEASSLASFLFSELRKNNPYFEQPDMEKWGLQIGSMIVDDRISSDVLSRLIGFSQRSQGWSRLIVSPYKLKVHFHKILLDMNAEEKKNNKLVPTSWRPLS
ncbi:MAG: hypothetical protein HF312_18895 [Ignavibacteria bacterium]|jgi:hypothetical protein|nr:hypothetical protein [Ignavibacteria bacterium]MCU7522291.1 hypothetical protein [Ignavibacteria bacterium]